MQQFEVVRLVGWHAVHEDGEGPDLSPASNGVGKRAQAGDGVQVQDGAGMDGERECVQRDEVRPLDRDAEGDESIIDDITTVALRRFLPGAGDFEVFQIGNG